MKVMGSAGKVVDIRMLGINEVVRRLQQAKKDIKFGADFGVVRAGGFVEEEVKESIAGHRAEIRSVRTGLLANSIEFDKTGEAEGVVKSKPTSYPDSNTTTSEVAVMLEYGTSKNPVARLHFTNTANRNKDKVKEIINDEVKRNLK